MQHLRVKAKPQSTANLVTMSLDVQGECASSARQALGHVGGEYGACVWDADSSAIQKDDRVSSIFLREGHLRGDAVDTSADLSPALAATACQ